MLGKVSSRGRRGRGGGVRLGYCRKEKAKKRNDYACRRQVNEKPSIIPGCPRGTVACMHHSSVAQALLTVMLGYRRC